MMAARSCFGGNGSSGFRRNGGMPLDVDLIQAQTADGGEVEGRAAKLVGAPAGPQAAAQERPDAEGEAQAVSLLRAVTMIDLTTLTGDETPGDIERLAAKARQPVSPDILAALGAGKSKAASVCVYPAMVPAAVAALEGTGIPVCSVAGFPSGRAPVDERVEEIHRAVEAGAGEIDVVIDRRHVLAGDWAALHDEAGAFRAACGAARLKTILATGELGTLENVARASWTCMMAGADFIKTSTGREAVNATLPAGLVMADAIRAYHTLSGFSVGLKPAGGIGTARQALEWLTLVKQELGSAWFRPSLFRIGASSLLDDIVRQLARYAADRTP